MPQFDGNKVTILDENNNPIKGTIMGRICKNGIPKLWQSDIAN